MYTQLVSRIDEQLRLLKDVWEKDLPAFNELARQVPAVSLE
ncbi:MAG TPA: hypothetical protein VFL80_05830 [Thermoanaerobaculia bacterium]|nr:hypothetical protein [Thermoanaerobaculia bacterium]